MSEAGVQRRPSTHPRGDYSKRIDAPQPGYYKTRLVKGGPWVPARILDMAGDLRCYVAGDDVDLTERWPWLHPVDEATYQDLLDKMPDDPRRRIDHLADAAPTFGREPDAMRRNSRDAELCASAEAALDCEAPDLADVALLVKQIIAERNRLEAARKAAEKPHRDTLAEIAREHTCEADAYRPRLLALLTAYGKAHGWQFPMTHGVTPHRRTTPRLVCDDAVLTPRDFLVPDETKIRASLKAGGEVAGWRIEDAEEAGVV